MAYKVAGDSLIDRITYLDLVADEPYRYYEYRLDKSIFIIKNILNVYLISIRFATDLSLCYKSSGDNEFIKIDLSLPECGQSEIYVTLKDIESHIIKSIINYDIINDTNIMYQLNHLDLFNTRCIVDTKKHQIEIFESTREYLDYHKPLNHIHLDISVDRTKL
jgi:hypothetical protein